jgi:hypothetical protein
MYSQGVFTHVAWARERLATLTARVRSFAFVYGTIMRRQVASVVEAAITLRTFERPLGGVDAATMLHHIGRTSKSPVAIIAR